MDSWFKSSTQSHNRRFKKLKNLNRLSQKIQWWISRNGVSFWKHLKFNRIIPDGSVVSFSDFSALCTAPSVLWHCWLVVRKSIRPVKNRLMRCWHGYLSGAMCKWFAYVPADATATPSCLASLKSSLVLPFCCRLTQDVLEKRPLNSCLSGCVIYSDDMVVVVDYRKPLFRRGITSLSDTRVGDCLTGSVTNVTHFGAFVDVGVGHDGLIHSSAISAYLLPPSRQTLEVGDHVEVRVKSVDVSRHRIGLCLVRLLIN